MALKAVHVADVPGLDLVPETPSLSLASARLPRGAEMVRSALKPARFAVIGHRGKGMNALASPDRRMREIKENSVLSFNEAGRFPVDFVEFDVQVTKDDRPIIFHDNFILTEENVGKPLLRKTKDGRVLNWSVESDDPFCTLQEAFERVDPHLGFNIELKFDDNLVYQDEDLAHILQVILEVVFKCAKDRPIIFSSFQPDAALVMRRLQNTYPVFFLTNGGTEIYGDARRNSLDEAIKHCLANGLQGIVSEVKAVFRNPSAIPRIKESNLALLTYGQLNNVPEAVYMQHLMGINGVIVDLVQEITEAVSEFISPEAEAEAEAAGADGSKPTSKPNFSQRELSFLLRLIPELVQ